MVIGCFYKFHAAVISFKAEAFYYGEAGPSTFSFTAEQNGFPLSRE
jgi:hypothetical protein